MVGDNEERVLNDMTKFRLIALMAIALLALWVAPTALAATADATVSQYSGPVDESGPISGGGGVVDDADSDAKVGIGDQITIAGTFRLRCFVDSSVVCSVVFEDGDGTQGRFTHGGNATFSEGSVIIDVTGAPEILTPGADGVLAATGLTVVASEGISVSGGGDGSLPRTGGEFAFLGGGLLALLLGGIALRRVTRRPGSENA